MNALTNKSSTAVAALSSLKAGLVNVASSITAAGGDPYLRLLRDGTWVYGAENVEIEEGSEWAINPLSLMHGWTAWTDYKKKANEKLGEVMVPATSPLPPRTDLRELTDEEGNKCDWDQQLSLQFQCLTGEDEGTQVQYNTTSVGGLKAVKGILNAIARQLEVDMENPVPVVRIKTDSYQHKTWGKTYVPEFEIVDWVPLDDQIKDPVKQQDTPDSDQQGEAPKEAEQVRTRQRGDDQTRAAAQTEITAEDRRRAMDASMAELNATRAADSGEAEPVRRRRR